MAQYKLFYSLLILSCFTLLILWSGCASQINNYGVNAYNQGDYDLAAKYWNISAQQGDYTAQYNLGLLWEQGLGKTPLDKAQASQWFLLSAQQGYVPAMVHLAKIQKEKGYEDAAISWFNLAARWGDANAIRELQSWGKPVPNADLLLEQEDRNAIAKQKAAEAWEDAAYQIGRALGGGSGGSTSAYSSTSTYTQSSSGQVIQSQSTNSEVECTSDYNCGIGYKCVKAPLKSSGVCMKSVDKFGLKQLNLPDSNSVGPNLDLDGQCTFDTDCPIGFKCDPKYKACIKK